MKRTILFLFIQLSCLSSIAQVNIVGKVIRVADGDTFTLLDSNSKQHRIRLHGIDCPEKTQDYYQVAKDFLGKRIFNQVVKVEILDKDRYGRFIGRVWYDGQDVNLLLLKNGLAWHYRYYDKSKLYSDAENSAKKSKIGIWSKPNPIAPWDFRRKK